MSMGNLEKIRAASSGSFFYVGMSLFLMLFANVLFSSCKLNKRNTDMAGSGKKQGSVYVVDLKAVDYAFGMPSEIPSGWITFRMENMGEEDHVALIYRSESDLRVEELRNKIDSLNYKFPKTLVGGPGIHSPGQKSDVALHLEPGNYMMICEEVDESRNYHSDLGMRKIFKVSEKSSGATKPKADVKIVLGRYSIQRKKTFASGEQTIEVVHKGFPYGLQLFRVQDSLSMEKAERRMDWQKDSGHLEWLTGAEPSDKVKSTFITYNFSPGEYAWTSYAYVWGVMDKFTIEKGESFHKLIEQEKKSNINKVGIKIKNNEIRPNNDIISGINTFYFKNEENDKHVIYLDKLKEGESKKSFLDWFKLAPANKTDGSRPMLVGYVKLNEEDSATVEIKPGKYLISCNANSENGERHRSQGEIAEFEVK